MRWLDAEYPGYGFAARKGYGGGKGDHEAAIRKMGRLSPAHRPSVHPTVYAEIDPDRPVSTCRPFRSRWGIGVTPQRAACRYRTAVQGSPGRRFDHRPGA